MDINIRMETNFLGNLEGVEEKVDLRIKQYANLFEGKVKRLANSNLDSSKESYIGAVYSEKVKDGHYTVGLNKDNKLANMIEKGAKAYDMKMGFLKSSKAKIGKNGSTYLDVPIKNTYKNTFINKKHEVGQKITKKTMPIRTFKSLGTRKQIIDPVSKATLFESYKHKANVLQAATVISKSSKKIGSALTIRRVSSNSDPMSWINKGIKKRDFFMKAYRELKNRI